MIKDFFLQIKNIIKFYQTPNEWKKNIFYSEGKNYFLIFTDYVHFLLKNNIKTIFITSDPNDPAYSISNENFKIFYCKNIYLKIILLNNIKCKNFIMTMPDLNNFEIKKSKFVKNYIYLFHSLVSSNMAYNYKAFNCYDTILCITKNQFNELSINKKINKLKYKLVAANFPKLEILKKKQNKIKKNLITIAPSWGRHNIFTLPDFEIMIENLIKNNYKIILRPHSQKSHEVISVLTMLKNKYNSKVVKIHYTNEKFDEILSSEYLITDWSGIAMEYSFTNMRPVIFIDTPKKIFNKRFRDKSINNIPTEVIIRDKIGIIIKTNDLRNVAEKISNLNFDKFKKNIKKSKSKLLFSSCSIKGSFGRVFF